MGFSDGSGCWQAQALLTGARAGSLGTDANTGEATRCSV